MTLDRTLVKDIKAAVGDGSRTARFSLLTRIDWAAAEASSPDICEAFGALLREHGRAVMAICVAATLEARRERLEGWQIQWARAVLDLWTTHPTWSRYSRAVINDGLHPTRICEYAGSFIRCTTESE